MNMGELVLIWLLLIPISPRDLKPTILIATTESLEQIDAAVIDQEARLAID